MIAQNNAAIQNEAMFAATIETGQRNMAALEQTVIKDNTLMPGEWYGGQLHIAPPTDQAGGQKSYTIVITVGQDRHVVDVNQGRRERDGSPAEEIARRELKFGAPVVDYIILN